MTFISTTWRVLRKRGHCRSAHITLLSASKPHCREIVNSCGWHLRALGVLEPVLESNQAADCPEKYSVAARTQSLPMPSGPAAQR